MLENEAEGSVGLQKPELTAVSPGAKKLKQARLPFAPLNKTPKPGRTPTPPQTPLFKLIHKKMI